MPGVNSKEEWVGPCEGNEVKVVCLKKEDGKVWQDCDVYIGREVKNDWWYLNRSEWWNPFEEGPEIMCQHQKEKALQSYRAYILGDEEKCAKLWELRGKRLGCFCKPGRCHGDVLRQMVNQMSYAAETGRLFRPEVWACDKGEYESTGRCFLCDKNAQDEMLALLREKEKKAEGEVDQMPADKVKQTDEAVQDGLMSGRWLIIVVMVRMIEIRKMKRMRGRRKVN